ncbi:polysaccharide deacetylase family protein [Chromobacterium haemolyticum]|nr:polysaccharide deacetylase family protein [Chromobacterium haemolyticum]
MREVRSQGFEVGIHTWDHIKWQDYVAGKDAAWTRAEMRKAAERFEQIFGEPARTHGAAGWQINDAALAYERELGMLYASDGRGTHPFQPVDAAGQPLGVPQLPTTLPTLDELIGLDGLTADNVHHHILALTEEAPATGHVYTLHAELEGLRLGYTLRAPAGGLESPGLSVVQLHRAVQQPGHGRAARRPRGDGRDSRPQRHAGAASLSFSRSREHERKSGMVEGYMSILSLYSPCNASRSAADREPVLSRARRLARPLLDAETRQKISRRPRYRRGKTQARRAISRVC